MTLVQHLEELRHRLLFCVAAVMAGTAVALVFHVITPGADPYSPLILGVAFTVLFFVSAGLVRFVRPASAADSIQTGSRGVDTGGSVTVERVA